MPLPGRRPAPVDWLIVGLGNPGAEYRGTPHNIGFAVARRLIERWRLREPRVRYQALITDGRAADGALGAAGAPAPRVAILMPQTYMNDSGKAVGPARGELHLEPHQILVVHDELDLPFGEIRTRRGGGLAGHNGLKSIRAALGSTDFHRVRIGVGRPPSTDSDTVVAFVLGAFKQPRAEVDALIDAAADAVARVLI